MLHMSTPKISLLGALKNAQKCKEKDAFYAELMIHGTMQSRSVPEGIFDGAHQDVLSNLHKDAQDGACEVALNGALGVALELHLSLHLLIQ